ncbi:hypothetical protein M8C21_026729 [Ambrosia artemisiifolia]|uniref:HMA domain-containing protein n=1 Tax=Ambrosia artemisiifolia TaxID=4212 RepID=A0AAD5D311_AMBAR|nr:hypothetical protein M8C21_026729 [Ambrosia artemisiifolia]
MVPELEKPRVTEIQVRMDCNGCVQKIKKALHGINGIYDIYIDIPQQKLTIIGWADPEKIVKAIKKTRKNATICSHTTALDSESEQPQEGEPSSSDTADHQPGEEAPPQEQAPPTEPPPEPENAPPDVAATQPPPAESASNQPPQSSRPNEVEEVHVVYRNPPDHTNNVRVYSGRVDHYPASQGGPEFGPGYRHEPPQPIHVNHSYHAYKPTPYVTEYEYIRPPPEYTPYSIPEPRRYASYSWPEPPQQQYTHYSRQGAPQHTYYSRQEAPQQHTYYSRQEAPQQHTYYSRQEAPQQRNSRPETPQSSYSRPEPPPQHYSRQEPPPQHYGQPEPPPQKDYADPPQQNRQPEPPQQYTHYNRPEPPRQYTQYSRPEPSALYTYYNRLEPPDYNMHYNGEYYHSSSRNDGITSPFGDEDPNGCKIV